MVIRADVKKNKGMKAKIKIVPTMLTQEVPVPNSIKQLNVIYPVTTNDRVVLYLEKEKGTSLENFRYAVVNNKQLPDTDKLNGIQVDNKIFKEILSWRKTRKENEFYDLTNDLGMTKNLINEKKFKRTIVKYKRRIYETFRYFFKKGKSIRTGKPIRGLTEKDKKVLKSVGYL